MRTTFSAIWTEQLGNTIRLKAPTIYPMDLVGTDAEMVKAAVNKGIDSHLEACFVPDRGDSYKVVTALGIRGRVRGPSLVCKVSKESLPILVRRLMESGDEHAECLAGVICETLNIELI